MKMNNKTIYLTLDDGPSSHTEQFLDILKKYHSYATFFVVGDMIEGREDIIRRIADEGHSIGVHAFQHEYDIIYRSTNTFWDDNLRARNLIKQITGKAPKIMRFPGGSSNTVSRHYCYKIMTKLAEQTKSYGYVYYDWNIHPYDTSVDNHKVQELYDMLMDGIHSDFKTPIILMHDMERLKNNSLIIEKMLDTAISEGYVFKALDENVEPVHHRIAN